MTFDSIHRLETRRWVPALLLVLAPACALSAQTPPDAAGAGTPPASPAVEETARAASPDAGESAAAPGEPAAGDEDSGIELETVPEVDLSGLEPAVADQLREVRGALDILIGAATRASASSPSLPELGASFGELGRYYQAYEMVEPAAACYRNAIRLLPDDPRWPHLLGRLLQTAGRLPEAAEALQYAIQKAPDDVASYVYLAEVRQLQGRPDDARTLYQEALDHKPGAPAALAGLGQASLEAGDAQRAVELLEAAVAAVPQADRLHYPLGLAYRQLGDEDRARENLLAAGQVGVRPEDPLVDGLEELKSGERAHLLRGHMAFRAGHFAEAANSYHRAVREVPNSAPAHVDLATALSRLGYTEGAEEELHKALALDPDSATAHYNLGALMLATGEVAGALVHLRQAIALDPDDGPSHAALGRALLADGDVEGALSEYQRGEALGAPAETGLLLEAQMLIERGRFADSRKLLEHAFDLLPSSVPILGALARLLAASPDPAVRDGDRALELAERAYAAGKTLDHGETMALALAQLGRCDEAATWQSNLIQVAQKVGADDLVPGYSKDLERYQAGPPCAPPVVAASSPAGESAPAAADAATGP